MLRVTDSAKQHLKATLLAHTEAPETGLRLCLEPSGRLSLVLDKEGYGDQVVEHEGSKVLLVESGRLFWLLEEATLDAQDTPDGPKLVIDKSKRD